MQKLNYDLQILLLLIKFKEQFAQDGIDVDTRYIDYHGDTCPRCKREFKVRNSFVNGASSVSAFLVMGQKKAVVYCVCKNCAKELAVPYGYITEGKGKNGDTEEYIYSILPYLSQNNVVDREGEFKIIENLNNSL